MSRKAKQKTKRRRIILKNERFYRDLYLKKYQIRQMNTKKYVKCSECGKIREDLTNSLKCFMDSGLVCDECFLYFAEKVRKW